MSFFSTNVIFLLSQNRVVKSKLLTVQNIDAVRVQVTGVCGSVNVVNLRDKKRTCRRFDLEKMPCKHAIAAAEKMNISCISLCHLYYHRSYLYNSYATAIMPRYFSVPVPEYFAIKVCSPPLCKQQPWRPKKSRVKPCLEIALEKKRARKQNACGNCNEVGHNRKTCKLP